MLRSLAKSSPLLVGTSWDDKPFSYKRDWERRKKWYEIHGLLGKVITLQDGPDGSIDSKEIERIAMERVLQEAQK